LKFPYIYKKNANRLLWGKFELIQEFHLVLGVINVFFGVLGGFYALRALVVLYRNPEMLKTQRIIWLPILIGGAFFTGSGLLYFAEHVYFSRSEMELLHEIFTAIGFSSFVIGVVKYSRLQIEYYMLKREALRKISPEHKQ